MSHLQGCHPVPGQRQHCVLSEPRTGTQHGLQCCAPAFSKQQQSAWDGGSLLAAPAPSGPQCDFQPGDTAPPRGEDVLGCGAAALGYLSPPPPKPCSFPLC